MEARKGKHMKCPICDEKTEAFDLNLLSRPVDPRLFRLAQQQRVCCACGWQSEGVEEVRFQNLQAGIPAWKMALATD
jgi:hypothetical protein